MWQCFSFSSPGRGYLCVDKVLRFFFFFLEIPCPSSLLSIHTSSMLIASRKVSVQLSSVAQSCLTLCDPMNHSTPGLLVHHQLLGSLTLTSIESVMPSSHLILCRPLFLLPPIPPSIRLFSNESTLRMRWPKYWSFSFSIIPFKEHLGLISFSNSTVQKHQFFGAQPSSQSNSHIHT